MALIYAYRSNPKIFSSKCLNSGSNPGAPLMEIRTDGSAARLDPRGECCNAGGLRLDGVGGPGSGVGAGLDASGGR